jgi:hypothetical protein
VDGLSQFAGRDTIGLDDLKPSLLDRAVLAGRQAKATMHGEEKVEVLEHLMGLVERTGTILDKASQFESDDPLCAGIASILVERSLQDGSDPLRPFSTRAE